MDSIVAAEVMRCSRHFVPSRVRVEIRPRTGGQPAEDVAADESRQLLREVVRAVGFEPDEAGLRGFPGNRLTRDHAMEIYERTISHGLAYRTRFLDAGTARKLTRDFFQFFGADAVFLTNGYFDVEADPYASGGCEPLTSATFDLSVVAVAADAIGCLLATDED